MSSFGNALSRYFQLPALHSSIEREATAGLTTFLAAMYIIIVNPSILGDAGLPMQAVLTSTVLVSVLSSCLMGIYAKNPIVLAPGMGLNAFFTYTVVIGMQLPWQQALGAVFWSGFLNLCMSLVNIRVALLKGMPRDLRYGVAAGIGLFITLVGLKNGGWVVPNPATIIGRGPLNAATLTFIGGLVLSSALFLRQIPGAFILGIGLSTLAAYPIGRFWGSGAPLVHYSGVWAWPDFSLLGQADLLGALRIELLPVIFAMAFTDLFDSLSTFVGVAEAGQLLDADGEPRRVRESLIVDSLATMVSGPLGSSAATSFIESAAGVEAGGRSGLTAVVAGLLFLPFLFLSPLLSMVPALATAPVLVLVGLMMLKTVVKINWANLEEAIPAFIACVFIPFTFSITQGLVWGFLTWTLLKIIRGKSREVPAVLWGIDALCILAMLLER